jgi:CubicO group peptidase (beta-lactamase class C family)
VVRSTRRSFVVGAGCAAAAALIARARGADSAAAVIDADPELRRLIDRERRSILDTMAKEEIPGAAICLVVDGKPAWIEGFGVTDRKSKRPIGVDTIFSIQSTSKNMTTTAIMLAAQRGMLDLDKPVAAYLPTFTVNSRFDARPQEKMTLRHLLSSRAGFTHDAPVGNNFDLSFPSFAEHVDSISQTWLRFPIGERFRYANLGFDLAGHILQTAANKPFAECLQTMVFDPLGMNDTTADTETYSQRANRAVGHRRGYESVPLRIPFIPAGGVYASARDLIPYLLFHLHKGTAGGRALLEEKRWDEMHSFRFGGAYSLGIAGGQLRFGDTDLWMLTHNGGGCGFGSVFRFYPQAKLGVAVLFNAEGSAAYRWGGALTDEILTRNYGKQTARTRIDDFAAAKLPRQALQKFVGNWIGREFARNFTLVDGVLVMQRDGNNVPVRTSSAVDIVVPGEDPARDAVAMRYFPARAGMPPHLESALGDGNLDYNDGPDDAPGPDKKEWDKYVGRYWVDVWGKPTRQVSVLRKNGYLYLDAVRMVVESSRGLFFMSDGEAVDFRKNPPTWRNIPLRRVED